MSGVVTVKYPLLFFYAIREGVKKELIFYRQTVRGGGGDTLPWPDR